MHNGPIASASLTHKVKVCGEFTDGNICKWSKWDFQGTISIPPPMHPSSHPFIHMVKDNSKKIANCGDLILLITQAVVVDRLIFFILVILLEQEH